MSAFEPEVVGKYLGEPYHCPYCGAEDAITADADWDSEADEAWQTVRCSECKKAWQEVFTMNRIEPVEEEREE